MNAQLSSQAQYQPYQISLSNSANKAQKKLDKALRILIRDALLKIAQFPQQVGEQLKQPLEGVRSHHIKYKGREFRVAYQVEEAANTVFVLLIGPHENFYRSLKQVLYS